MKWLRSRYGLLLVAFLVFGVYNLRVYTRQALDAYFRGDTLTTPDLRGFLVDDAAARLRDSLVLEVARQTYDPKVPRGTIISQQPTPGIRVRRGKTIFLRISKGADLQAVPSVTGLALRKASIGLRNEGLQVGTICLIRDPATAGGTVLQQTPHAGEQLGRGGRVDLLVATTSKERRGLLPRVTGLDQDSARAALKVAGIQRIHRLEVVAPRSQPGLVLSQDPRGGTFYEADTVVKLTLAVPTGPPQKHLELVYRVPPGLSERSLVITLEDDGGRRVVHRASHLPGEQVVLDAAGQGAVHVEYYLDDFLVTEEAY